MGHSQMNEENPRTHHVNLLRHKNQTERTKKTLAAIQTTIAEAHQLIRKTQTAHATSIRSNVQMTKNKLSDAIEQIHQLENGNIDFIQSLSDEIKQNLTQLTYQIEQAYRTLLLIDRAISRPKL